MSNLKQIGDDRVVVFEFSSGLYYLVMEFFSAGNIILLDENLKILSLQRLVLEKENNDKYAVGEPYNLFDKTLFEEKTHQLHTFTLEEVSDWIKNQKIVNNKVLSIHKLLFLKASYLSSDLIQMKLSDSQLTPSESSMMILEDEEKLKKVVQALNAAETSLNDILQQSLHKGFILSKKNPIYDATKPESVEFIYEDFAPFVPSHKPIDNVEEIEGYNKTLDKFFTTLELKKNSLKEQQLQINSEKRLQLVKDENQLKIDKLEQLKAMNIKKAELIMINSDIVENCKSIVQSLIDQQMDWQNIDKLINVQKQRGNEMAQYIVTPLNLKENKINLSLPEIDYDGSESDSDTESESDSDSDSDDDSNEKNQKKGKRDNVITVTIDLSLSAFANSSTYFDAKKDAQLKQLKTEQNASIAIKNTERKINKDLKKIEKDSTTNQVLKQIRTKSWFEKFFWFISGDGYLCIAGRDASQIDLIYFKHFNNESDYFVSNDLDNSLKVVIKNPYKNKEVPPMTLYQAGVYSLSTTKAWENKIITSLWFVKGSEVTKKDFDGSLLQAGMLNVTKEKTYLPPAQLNYGIGFLWIGDDKTSEKYVANRVKRDEDLGFKLVNDNQLIVDKRKELESLVTKLEKELEKEQEKQMNKVEEEVKKVNVEAEEEEEKFVPTPYTQIQLKVRGKKSKLKKIKQKYGDQDEEERKLRMQILGNVKQTSSQESVAAVNASEKSNGAWKVSRKKQTLINQLKKILEDLQDSTEDDDEERPQLVSYRESLDKLILSPLKTDTIVEVVPVFAPWSSLQKYKYKTKIQPGNLKKGKIISDLLEYYKKDHLKKLKEEGDEWFDDKNLISNTNQQDLLLTITVNKMKIATGADTQKKRK